MPDVSVRGAVHEAPDVVLTLHFAPRVDGLTEVSCMSIAGAEFATVVCDQEAQLVSELRANVATALRFPSRKLRLILPDGRLLSDVDNGSTIALAVYGCSQEEGESGVDGNSEAEPGGKLSGCQEPDGNRQTECEAGRGELLGLEDFFEKAEGLFYNDDSTYTCSKFGQSVVPDPAVAVC